MLSLKGCTHPLITPMNKAFMPGMRLMMKNLVVLYAGLTEDWEMQVPTIPVLLRSVRKTRWLLTIIHLGTLLGFMQNPYIILGSLYAVTLVWLLDENSPRKAYRFSFHSQTLVVTVYGLVRLYNARSYL